MGPGLRVSPLAFILIYDNHGPELHTFFGNLAAECHH